MRKHFWAAIALVGLGVVLGFTLGHYLYSHSRIASAGDEVKPAPPVAEKEPVILLAGGSVVLELKTAVESLSQKCEDLTARLKKVEAAAAEERDNASRQQETKNGWRSSNDWDGQGERPSGYLLGATRYEAVPEDRLFKKYLRDLPRGMQAWVRSDALRIDRLRHGWLRADALVADDFLPEFPVRVTRWDGGYYVYPPRSFQIPDPTFIGGEPAWLRVKEFCWSDGIFQYVLKMPPGTTFNFDGVLSEPALKKPDK